MGAITKGQTGLIYSTDFSALSDWPTTDSVFASDAARASFTAYSLPAPVLTPAAPGASDGGGCREPNLQIDAAGRWHLFYDAGDGTGGTASARWRTKRAYSDDAGLTWTKASDVSYTGLPGAFSTATSHTHVVRYGGTYYAYCMSPDTYNNGIPGTNYHTIVMSAPALEGPYTFVGETLILGAAGSFDEATAQINSVVNDVGTITGYYSARTAGVTGTAWTIGRATATSPAGPWTKDGNLGGTIRSEINNASGVRAENAHVWYSKALGKWIMLTNSVDSTSAFTDGNDLIYADSSNGFKNAGVTTGGAPVITQVFADTFTRTAGAVGNGWTVNLVNGNPVVNGTELDLGSTVGASLIHRESNSMADSVQTADLKIGAFSSIGFITRWIDGNNFMFLDILPPSGGGSVNGRATMTKVIGGTETIIGSFDFAAGTVADDTYFTGQLITQGDTFTLKINGVQVWAYTDTSNGGHAAITAAGGVGLRNGNGGTGVRRVKNYTQSSIVAAAGSTNVGGSYRTRIQRVVPSDSVLAVGMGTPLRDLNGNTLEDDSGRVAMVYDADPPATFNSAANTGYHQGRRIRAAILEPAPYCLRVIGASAGSGFLLRSIAVTDFTAELATEFQNSASQAQFAYRFNTAVDASHTGYVVDINNSTRAVTLYRKAGTVLTSLSTGTKVATPTAPDASNAYLERVKVIVTGNRHQIFVDSTTALIDYTDATPATAGPLIGFRNGNSSSDLRIRGFSVRKSDAVMFSGLPANAKVTLRSGGYPLVTGTADGFGNLTLTSPHYPAGVVQVNAEVMKPGDVWGGDTFTYSGGVLSRPAQRRVSL